MYIYVVAVHGGVAVRNCLVICLAWKFKSLPSCICTWNMLYHTYLYVLVEECATNVHCTREREREREWGGGDRKRGRERERVTQNIVAHP